MNNALLDTYQLKSLDAVLEAQIDRMKVVRNGSRYMIDVKNGSMHRLYDNFAMREPYDRIIRCLGFQYNESLFSR